MYEVFNASGDVVYTVSGQAISSDASLNACQIIDYTQQLNQLVDYGEACLITVLLLATAYMLFKEIRGWR